MAQPADTAALESLPHVQMPLDGAPLDEARLGIGEDLEIFFVTNTLLEKETKSQREGIHTLNCSAAKKTLTLDPPPGDEAPLFN